MRRSYYGELKRDKEDLRGMIRKMYIFLYFITYTLKSFNYMPVKFR